MGKINANPGEKTEYGRNLRVLVAPLDWGLGHATRCIPIIQHLVSRGVTVFLAGTGAQEHLLRTEFPELPFLQLPGYDIRYAKTGSGMPWRLAAQVPRILKAIRTEHRWLKNAVRENNLHGVVSDNRYGLYHSDIPAVFMTHQLQIRSGLGRWLDKQILSMNYRYIRKFDACWVPDNHSAPGLAGELSHPMALPGIPVHYLGPLSRFEQREVDQKPGHLLVLLSGPEPQRTYFENAIVRQISHYNGTATVVRGLPDSDKLLPSTRDLVFYNHLPANLLNDEILKAEYIISRSGYTTIMDLAKLGRKAIMVPTPGQAEQEYLAAHMSAEKRAVISEQHDFNLIRSLLLARGYPYEVSTIGNSATLHQIIDGFLEKISRKQ